MGKSLTHKILAAHLVEGQLVPGTEIGIKIDQVLLQDYTATQAMLAFETMGLQRHRVRVAACYADHKVYQITPEDMQDHLYLQTACRKYGFWYGKPAIGIGHQVHLEHFAVPGETVLGGDSHTPHCGGVGMLAIGAGGMDVALALGGGPYYFQMPAVVNVRLTGELRPWCTAKDVILELLRRLTVRGGLGKIFEFTGPGIASLNAQQRVTITNMSYELGATTSIFPSDAVTRDFFRRLGREHEWRELLPDPDATYDEVIELDLSTIEPLIALPSLPDKVVPVREVAGTRVHQVMVGSCTNGSYTDIVAVARILKGRRVHPDVYFFIHPSSRQALELLAREGYVADLLAAGVEVAEPTCGACIGAGHVPAPGTKSLRAINRNFKGRSGLKDDEVYLASAETAAATALKGVITDPRDLGAELGIPAPSPDLPVALSQENPNLVPPAPPEEAARLEVVRGPNIVVTPLKPPLEETLRGEVLLKLGDDISTDHIIPASPEYAAYRANVPKLSEFVFHRLDPTFSQRAKEKGGGWIVGGANYGIGSSREHAAICPMYLGIKGVITKSFARIHRANLINWGLLPLTFADPADYDWVEAGDLLVLENARDLVAHAEEFALWNATKGRELRVRLTLTPRERQLILWGGKLAYVKANPVT